MIKRILTLYLPATVVITTVVIAGVLFYRAQDPSLSNVEFQTEITENAELKSANFETQEEIPAANVEAEDISTTDIEIVQEQPLQNDLTNASTQVIADEKLAANETETEVVEVPEVVVTLSGPGVAVRCPVEFSKEITVHQLMKQAATQCDFSYTVKDFTSLGAFVDELGGVQSDQREGKYWIYYVNGKKANVGVSTYRVQAEDLIAWKYEQEY